MSIKKTVTQVMIGMAIMGSAIMGVVLGVAVQNRVFQQNTEQLPAFLAAAPKAGSTMGIVGYPSDDILVVLNCAPPDHAIEITVILPTGMDDGIPLVRYPGGAVISAPFTMVRGQLQPGDVIVIDAERLLYKGRMALPLVGSHEA